MRGVTKTVDNCEANNMCDVENTERVLRIMCERTPYSLNIFTTIHDGNFRRHSSMNVTIK